MKYLKKTIVLMLLVLIASCTTDDESTPDRGVVVSTLDLNATILDNAEFGYVVGNVKGRTNIGLVAFEIVSQTPEGALAVDEIVGELTVANPSVIDASVNPEINLIVSVTNGDIIKNANITVFVEAAPVDNDGDGLLSDVDPDDNDPCSPSQSPNYSGFDATNPIWMAADCDGDGDNNGIDDSPYGVDGDCNSSVDTSIWSGVLSFSDASTTFGDTFFYDTNPVTPTSAGCGSLIITDPLNLDFDFGPCPAGSMLEITLIFTPAFDGATNGTVTVSEQGYTCDFIETDFTASGTYDEISETIILDYNAQDRNVDGGLEGVLTITTNP